MSSGFKVEPHHEYDKSILIKGGEVYLNLDNDDVPPGMPEVAERIAEILTEHFAELDAIVEKACQAYNAEHGDL